MDREAVLISQLTERADASPCSVSSAAVCQQLQEPGTGL